MVRREKPTLHNHPCHELVALVKAATLLIEARTEELLSS